MLREGASHVCVYHILTPVTSTNFQMEKPCKILPQTRAITLLFKYHQMLHKNVNYCTNCCGN